MKAGLLRHRIEIHQSTVTFDEIGNQIVVWQKVAEVWASVEPLRGNEYMTAAYLAATVSHRVTMRPPGVTVTPAEQIVFNGRIFNIESVINPEERNQELQLMCRELV